MHSLTANVPLFRFSAEAYPERERLTAWREIFGRTVCNLDIDSLGAGRFRSDAAVCQLPGLGLLVGSTTGVRLTHSKELIVDDDLSFMTGPMLKWNASQLGRHVVLGSGDGVLMNNAEVGMITLPESTPFLTFRVPAAAIRSLVVDIDGVVARRVPADSEALRLLARYLGVLQDASLLNAAQVRDLAVTHAYDLLALALGATRDAAEIAERGGLRAARLQAILAEIKARTSPIRISLRRMWR